MPFAVSDNLSFISHDNLSHSHDLDYSQDIKVSYPMIGLLLLTGDPIWILLHLYTLS
jgi:hypothetical protein